VTTIVQVTVAPLATDCSFGFFVIAIAGVPGGGGVVVVVTVNGSHGPSAAL